MSVRSGLGRTHMHSGSLGLGSLGRPSSAPSAPPATVSTLASMTISAGTLSPTFDPGTTSYTVSITNPTATVTVTPTVTESHATIQVRVNGGSYAAVTSGQASGTLAMNVGANTIDVKVTAQDTTTTTYTTTATRAAAYASVDSITFNGSSHLANTADTADHKFSTVMTVSFWMKSTASAANGIVTKADIAGNFSWYFGWNASGKMRFILSHNGGFDTVYASTSTTPFNGSWHHIVATFGASTLNMYIDGALDAGSPVSTGYSTIYNSTYGLQIGCLNSGGPTYYYPGRLDELSLWNVAFSATDVTNLYNSGHPADLSLHAQYSNLKSWYKLGDGDTITSNGILDSVGGHHLNPVNMNSGNIVVDAP